MCIGKVKQDIITHVQSIIDYCGFKTHEKIMTITGETLKYNLANNRKFFLITIYFLNFIKTSKLNNMSLFDTQTSCGDLPWVHNYLQCVYTLQCFSSLKSRL